MRTSYRKGCAAAVLGVLILMFGLMAWALAGTIGLDGPAPPKAPQPLSSTQGSFELEVAPEIAPIDAPIQIRVRGLEAGESVIVRASTVDASDVTFSSWARFAASDVGTLDLSQEEPLEGTYDGVDASGLLWSMLADGGEHFVTSSRWAERHIQLAVETRGGVLERTLTRRYPWVDTEREEITEPGLVAELTVPTFDGPLPVVILLAGWGDGPAPLASALLASKGYAVLNVGFHHWEGTPELLVEIPVETVTNALDWIKGDDRFDASRVGIYGTSKGAELALVAAVHDVRLRAIAAWVPSSIVFSGIDFRNSRPGSSWTLRGQPLPWAPARVGLHEVRNSLRFLMRRPLIFGPSYINGLAGAPEEATIAVEQIDAPILLVSGSDDQVWPSSLMSNQIAERRRTKLQDPRVTNLVFEGAGHGITYNLWPSGGKRTGMFFRGGRASIDHRSGQVAWAATLEFFDQHLANAPPQAERLEVTGAEVQGRGH